MRRRWFLLGLAGLRRAAAGLLAHGGQALVGRIAVMRWLRRLGSELGVFVLWLVHFLPMALGWRHGAGLGWLLYQFGRGHVTRVNLGLAFPEMTEQARHDLGLKHFRWLGAQRRRALHLWGSERQLMDLIRVEGMEHLHAAAPAGGSGDGTQPAVVIKIVQEIQWSNGAARTALRMEDTPSVDERG